MRKQMFVLDAFIGHFNTRSQIAFHAKNADLVVIPGRMTFQFQVLDVVVSKPI
jgi:hypothetical protein